MLEWVNWKLELIGRERVEEMKRNMQTANFGVVKKGAAKKKVGDKLQGKGKKLKSAKESVLLLLLWRGRERTIEVEYSRAYSEDCQFFELKLSALG